MSTNFKKSEQVKQRRDAVLKLWEQKKLNFEIAAELGVSPEIVNKDLFRMGKPCIRISERYQTADGKRVCKECGQTEPSVAFYNNQHGQRMSKCDRCRYLDSNLKTNRGLRHKFIIKRIRAKQLGVAFNLTWEEFLGKWKAQNGLSAYTKKPMVIIFGGGKGQSIADSLSFDRIVPGGDYDLSNTVLCTHSENRKKHKKSVSELPLEWQMNLQNLLDARQPQLADVAAD
jgi:hypothetical protein